MKQSVVSVYRWTIAGALIGAFLTIAVQGVPPDVVALGYVSTGSYIAGILAAGGLFGGIIAIIINYIRRR